MNEKKKSSNLMYALKLVGKADPFLLGFTIFKNSIEQVFNVFFFVYLTKYIYECIERGIAYDNLFRFLVIACSCHIVIHFICGWYETYRKINAPEVARFIFHKVLVVTDNMELKDFEDSNFYDRYARALDKSVDDAMNLSIKFGVFVGNVLAAAMSLALVFSVDWALIFFMIIPMWASFYFGKKNSQNNFERTKNTTREKRIIEYVKRVFYEKKYAAELRLYNIDKVMLKKQQHAVSEVEKKSAKYCFKSAMYSFFMYCSYSVFAGVGAYFYVAIKINCGNIQNIAGYIAMISAMVFSVNQLKSAVENSIYIGNESKLFGNLKEFLESEAKRENGEIDCGEIRTVEFKNVSFKYPGAVDYSLKNIDFIWNRGDKVALVGYNGAGKTTFVKLLMGLYPITEGKILINGIDLQDIDKDKYRKRFGTVFQDHQVFAMSLAENVLMRRPKTDEDKKKVIESLKLADFDVDKVGLKNGLESIISREYDENGFVCSGGQAQKIAIARIFAHNPEMIILDEPSSALDPLAEYRMYCNMMELAKGKGIIFISHRLSTAKTATKIYMMKNGSIIESGTHYELMGAGGEYQKMFMLQAQNYQESIPSKMETSVLYGK